MLEISMPNWNKTLSLSNKQLFCLYLSYLGVKFNIRDISIQGNNLFETAVLADSYRKLQRKKAVKTRDKTKHFSKNQLRIKYGYPTIV